MSDQFTRGIDQGTVSFKRLMFLCFSLIIISMPLFTLNDNATAAQITSRSLTIGSAQISTSTTYNFSFVPATAAAIQGLQFQACTTALGTCTAPSGLSFSSGAFSALTGTWTTSTNFTFD